MKLTSRIACAAALATVVAGAILSSPAFARGGSGGGGGGNGGGGVTSADPGPTGELMVKLSSTSVLPGLLAKYPLTLVSRFGSRPIYRLKVIGTARVQDLLPLLAVEPGVMIAEDNPSQRSPEARKNVVWAIGTQQGYVAQWGPQAMRLPEAQQLSTGAGVRVAVLDTGIDARHPALAGRLLPGFDFVDYDTDPSEGGSPGQPSYGHGTHVAGLIALAAPGAKIMPIRVLDADGVGNSWVLAEAILYALDPDGNPATDDGAHVINLSLGSLARTGVLGAVLQIAACTPAVSDDPVLDRSDPGYADDEARCANGRPGTVVVAAAGNDASDKVKEYPAAEGAYSLIAVAASNSSHKVASFSNFGGWIDLAAPGEGLTSAMAGGGYATWSGTSMAAPLVTGTAALVRARFPAMPAKDLARLLDASTGVLCSTKMGQLDAWAAVTATLAPSACR